MLKTAAFREEFVNENLYALKVDSAKGEGEYLQALAALSGCEGRDAQNYFGAKVRSHFDSIYDGSLDQDPDAVLGQIDQLIQGDPEMQRACRIGGNALAST
jgi:hypothetical protein